MTPVVIGGDTLRTPLLYVKRVVVDPLGESRCRRRDLLVPASVLLVGAALSPSSAREYKHSGCGKAAEMKFPTDRVARKEFKH
jgi:hypothetical protein